MTKVWRPLGIDQKLEEVLSVAPPPDGQMTPTLYRALLQAKIAHMIAVDPQMATRAMQQSADNRTDWWTIAQAYPQSEWPQAIVRSERMDRVLSRLKMEGVLTEEPPPMTMWQFLTLLP